jgi:hypothetical protein
MAPFRRNEHPRQALLIGTPNEGDVSMHNDLAAMYDALKIRGLASEEILSIEGNLDRQILMPFLEGVSHRIAQWREGQLFLYLSGHGFFSGDIVEDARVGIQLQKATAGSSVQNVYWDEVFSTLSIPEVVTVTMLIDH